MKRIICLIILIVCCGCTTIEYPTENGLMTYRRVGGTQVDNFSVTRTTDGDILVEFDKYIGEGMAGVVAAAVKAAVEAAK